MSQASAYSGQQSIESPLQRIKQYEPWQQNVVTYGQPEIIQVMEDGVPQGFEPTLIDLLGGSDLASVGNRSQETASQHSKSKLLANPNRHALMESDEPERIAIPRVKPKLLADPNKHAMIDMNWDPAQHSDAPANAQIEQRDDNGVFVQGARVGYEPEGLQGDLNEYLRLDPSLSEGRSAPADMFRDYSCPSECDSKSVTSSILGKRIPRRAKSVSWNLPDDEKSGSTARSSKRGGSVSSRSHDERAVAARKELARLSQKQAMLVARGQQLARGSIDYFS